MDSFMIKYDLNDLIAGKKRDSGPKSEEDIEEEEEEEENRSDKKTSECVCGRLASILDGVLNAKSKPSENGFQQQQQTSELSSIQKELKLLRKYQFDLSNKFNAIMNKLSGGFSSPKSASLEPNNQQIEQQQNQQQSWSSRISRSTIESSGCLTGAKKRKFNQKWRNDQSKPSDEDDELTEENEERNCQSRVSNMSSSNSSNNLNEEELNEDETLENNEEMENNHNINNNGSNEEYEDEEEGSKAEYQADKENGGDFEEEYGEEYDVDNQTDEMNESEPNNQEDTAPLYDAKYQVHFLEFIKP